MKRILNMFLFTIIISLGLSSCVPNSSKEVKFSIDNGDTIILSLDTSDGYYIKTDVPFAISKNGEDVVMGTFLKSSAYDEYLWKINLVDGPVITAMGEAPYGEYIAWSEVVDGEEEYGCNIKLNDSSTSVQLSGVSQDALTDVFERLSFTVQM